MSEKETISGAGPFDVRHMSIEGLEAWMAAAGFAVDGGGTDPADIDRRVTMTLPPGWAAVGSEKDWRNGRLRVHDGHGRHRGDIQTYDGRAVEVKFFPRFAITEERDPEAAPGEHATTYLFIYDAREKRQAPYGRWTTTFFEGRSGATRRRAEEELARRHPDYKNPFVYWD